MIGELAYAITMTVKNITTHKGIITKNAMTISWITVMSKKRSPLHQQLQSQKYGRVNYLEAINVAKFAHRKSTSQLENPLFLAISIFSIMVYGISTFSSASLFCTISYSL